MSDSRRFPPDGHRRKQMAAAAETWAAYLEQRNTSNLNHENMNDKPGLNQENKTVSEAALDDLQLDGLLHMSANIEDRRNVDAFVESILYQVDIEDGLENGNPDEQLEAPSKGQPDPADTEQPFVILERLHPNGKFLSEDDEYEIPAYLTSSPHDVKNGKRLNLTNGHAPNADAELKEANNVHDPVTQEPAIPDQDPLAPPQTGRSRLSVPAPPSVQKRWRGESELSASNHPDDNVNVEPAQADPARAEFEPETGIVAEPVVRRSKKVGGLDMRIAAGLAAMILFSLGLAAGYFIGMGSATQVADEDNDRKVSPRAANGDQENLVDVESKSNKNRLNPDSKTSPENVQNKMDREQIVNDQSREPGNSNVVQQDEKPDSQQIPKSPEGKQSPDSNQPQRIVQTDKSKGQSKDPFQVKPERRSDSWLATIKTGLGDSEWKVRPGKELRGDEVLELTRGKIELEMKNGAQLTIASPARFQIVNWAAVDLQAGTISAHVPKQAIGFSVLTPSSKVVDLGTDFEVTVDDQQISRVSVQQGLVEVETKTEDPTKKQRWQQKAGQSAVISREGNAVEWLLSFRFDNNGFGVLEFNGKTFKDVIMAENAEFTLRNIIRSVSNTIRAAEPFLESPLHGAIVIDDQTFVFENADQIFRAHNLAAQAIRKTKVAELNLADLLAARKQFVVQHEAFMKQVKDALEATANGNLNVHGNNRALRFPTANSAVQISSTGQQDIIKTIVAQTKVILDSKRRKSRPRNSANEKARLQRQQDQTRQMVAQVARFSGLGQVDMDDLMGQEQMRPVPDSLAKIQDHPEDALRQQLNQNVRSLNLFHDDEEARRAIAFVKTRSQQQQELDRNRRAKTDEANLFEPLRDFIPRRPHLEGLPITMGQECRLEQKEAGSLGRVSNYLGRTISNFNRFGSLPSFADQKTSFRDGMVTRAIGQCVDRFGSEHSVSGLVQMLQADSPRVRYELVSILEKAGTDEAAIALARRAKYDLDPEVRLAATEALKKFKPEQYQKELIDGFQYPWPVVAQHSAEAISRLGDKTLVDDLIAELDKPNPLLPFKNDDKKIMVRELISINHMRNCLLCHAPSTRQTDSVRGNIPSPGEPLPQQYYQTNRGSFVRADVTYLKQDFSVMQPVPKSKFWPSVQRFDYVVRTRELTPTQQVELTRNMDPKSLRAYRDSIGFALRELTKQNPAKNDVESWKAVVKEMAASRPVADD